MDRQRLRRATLATGLWAIVVGAGVAGLMGCGGNSNNKKTRGVTPNSIISIVPGAFNKGVMAFSPASDTVHVGHIVRMQNNDSMTHVIMPSPLTTGGPNWGTISAGRFADYTATAQGIWPYHCTVLNHTMNGELVVLP